MRRSDLGKRRRKVIIQTSRRGGINQEKKTSFEAFLEIGPLIICKRMEDVLDQVLTILRFLKRCRQ